MERPALQRRLGLEESEVAELRVKLHEAAYFGQTLLEQTERTEQELQKLRRENKSLKAAAAGRCVDRVHAIVDSHRKRTPWRRSRFFDGPDAEGQDSDKAGEHRVLLGARAAEWDAELEELLSQNKSLRRAVAKLENAEQGRLVWEVQEQREAWGSESTEKEERERLCTQGREKALSDEREQLRSAQEEVEELSVTRKQHQSEWQSELSRATRQVKLLRGENTALETTEAFLRSQMAELERACEERLRSWEEVTPVGPPPTAEAPGDGMCASLSVGSDPLAKELGVGASWNALALDGPGCNAALAHRLDCLREELVGAKAFYVRAEQELQQEARRYSGSGGPRVELDDLCRSLARVRAEEEMEAYAYRSEQHRLAHATDQMLEESAVVERARGEAAALRGRLEHIEGLWARSSAELRQELQEAARSADELRQDVVQGAERTAVAEELAQQAHGGRLEDRRKLLGTADALRSEHRQLCGELEESRTWSQTAADLHGQLVGAEQELHAAHGRGMALCEEHDALVNKVLNLESDEGMLQRLLESGARAELGALRSSEEQQLQELQRSARGWTEEAEQSQSLMQSATRKEHETHSSCEELALVVRATQGESEHLRQRLAHADAATDAAYCRQEQLVQAVGNLRDENCHFEEMAASANAAARSACGRSQQLARDAECLEGQSGHFREMVARADLAACAARNKNESLVREVMALQGERDEVVAKLAAGAPADHEVRRHNQERASLMRTVTSLEVENEQLREGLRAQRRQQRRAADSELKVQELSSRVKELQQEIQYLSQHLAESEELELHAHEAFASFRASQQSLAEQDLRGLVSKVDALGCKAQTSAKRGQEQRVILEELQREREDLREQTAISARRSAEAHLLQSLQVMRQMDAELYP